MAALPAGSSQAKMAVVNRGGMGYGENEKPPPYMEAKKQGRFPESWIRKLHGETERR